jgi:aldehyde dehydrogenase
LVKKRAEVLSGGSAGNHEGEPHGYYIQPTILKGEQQNACLPRRNLRTSCSFDYLSSTEEAIEIANDTTYG